ncbi:ferrous iron transport protein B [Desulfovibrio sulfodismutans]|uniref:Ferrous iron transport protein B n=1 Tax=Desulfolutivibrio sulfodismutans TaxID=63561 RepID=A0A7K3NHH9_9BACT|nr:ferrous iron transport protein B [Desulfolutivibrio sulfodismutans]NDY55656.1 ferrous iron transport protein B [Desulfolutivibrio sulfodismutans]QLA11648.1 ferrous iron transport protein B [Desulfolutivibrio sulfodismutans DSM 3696]
MKRKALVALAGQPNCGKSTVFNMLTGARQHVANYPGVTVEKKSGFFAVDETKVELVDLPGTYSLSSYSLEERVARDFLIHDHPVLAVNVIEAPNLRRSLSLTFQILELELPTLVVLNMMDMADKRGMTIDIGRLAEKLGAPVVTATARKGQGREEVAQTIKRMAAAEDVPSFRIDYGPLEYAIGKIEELLPRETFFFLPRRWLAIKLLEEDAGALHIIREHASDAEQILEVVRRLSAEFRKENGEIPESYMAYRRHALAGEIVAACVDSPKDSRYALSDRIDAVVCNKFAGPLILVAVIFLLYYLSIDVGYQLTGPLVNQLLAFKAMLSSLLPAPGIIEDPLFRSLGIWFMESMVALLTYIPIFLILFALIAVLEDSGYMPRMAFILDKLFRNFGLHGQSTLPLILAGVYMGGCCVPGVMATKGIPDERARLATILIVPMMNCLAKVPLYVVLVAAFFPQDRTLAMFFISTVTLFMALPVAKVLTLTVLRKLDQAPFIMEMPAYHFPTLKVVAGRSIERTWIFVKKIVSIVAAVSVIIFALLQFPGLSEERLTAYGERWSKATEEFRAKIGADNAYQGLLAGENLDRYVLFADAYRQATMGLSDQSAADAVAAEYAAKEPGFAPLLKPAAGDKDAAAIRTAMRTLDNTRKTIRREMKNEQLNASFLGALGEMLVPVTKYAGFDTKVNISLLAAFAAKESTVSTLGALYTVSDGEKDASLDQRLKTEMAGYTPLHALALMLFMALYPPCLATSIMVQLQTKSTKWMLFSIGYLMFLGITVSSAVFTGAGLLGLSGMQAMWTFYGLAVLVTIILGLYNPQPKPVAILKEKPA